jgi:potassium efflux system protein
MFRSVLFVFWSTHLLVAATAAPSGPAAAPAVVSQPQTATPKTAAKPDGEAAPADLDSEETAPEAPALVLTDRKDLERRLAAVAESGLSEEQAKRAGELFQQALDSLAVAEKQIAAARSQQTQLDALDEARAKAAAQLAAPLKAFEDVSADSLAEIEKRAENVDDSLENCRDQLAKRESWLANRSQRLADLPKEIADVRLELRKLAENAASPAATEVANLLAVAEQKAEETRTQALQATAGALDLELRYLQNAAELYQLERDHWARLVAKKEKRLAQLREEINRRREAEAQLAQQQARQAAEDAASLRPAAIVAMAEENARLAEERTELTALMTASSQDLTAASENYNALVEEFTRAQKQDEFEELSDGMGQLLRQQRAALPSVRELKRRKLVRDGKRSEIMLSEYNLRDRRSQLADLDEQTSAIVAQMGAAGPQFEGEVRGLLEARGKYLESLILDHGKYLKSLVELDAAESNLLAIARDYGAFIARRVMWIRSCQTVGRGDARGAVRAFQWSFDPANLRETGTAFGRAALRRPAILALFATALSLLLAIQRRSRRRLAEVGVEAGKRGCTRLRPTLEALGVTIMLAAPWPATLAFFGWFLDNPLIDSEYVRALAAALRMGALCLLLVELLRHLCRPGGLGEMHFQWPETSLGHIRRQVRWLTALGAPLTVWLTGLEVQAADAEFSSSLGRLAFVVTMGLLAAVLYRLLMARQSPFRQLIVAASEGWLAPMQWAWRPAATALPVALAVLALAGYYYTAQQAALGLLETASLVLGLLTLGGVTRRWLTVNRRRLAREQAKQRRALAEATGDGELSAELPDDVPDLAAISEQTKKLLRTLLAVTTAAGLTLIWADLLPALSYLGDHSLIPGAQAVDGNAPLTWGELLASLAVLAITYVSVRDVPALLELVVLQHLPLESGFRYAVTTLCRYALTALGVSLALHSVGVEWQDAQWLIAAMSVGLGFGLQEIFGNFVSGVILLFERPIRVGDIVTLGETTGIVSRIRMRATTIVDWDRKEYIVPNKDLVTQRLLNWTLSDHTNRVVVTVGVSYGSDTEKACRLLMEAAGEQPHVLADPPPVAFFEGFGDSALNLKLMCFLPDLEHRLQTIHALHTAIDAKFKTAGLEIPFPQRDMNINLSGVSRQLFDATTSIRSKPSRRPPGQGDSLGRKRAS